MTAVSYFHRGGDDPLSGLTINDYVRRIAAKHPDNEAVVCVQQNVRYTYSQLMDEVEKVARGLISLGVERGDRVGIWSTDNVEWVLMQLATAHVGAILVNINPAYRVAELRHGLRLARVQLLVLIPDFRSSNYVDMVRELCPELETGDPDDGVFAELPDLRRVIVYDPADTMNTERPASGFLVWRELVERGQSVTVSRTEERLASLDCDDPVNIQFTSGTTGFPKAVVLTHHNILNNGRFIGDAMSFTPADRLCVPVPFYHCFGMVVSNLACLTHGATIVIPSAHFDADAVLDTVAKERCTALHGVPTMFVAELERPDFKKHDLSSLRTGIMAGAPCPPALMRRVIDEMGCREVLIAYGLTEASPVTHLTMADDSFERRTESVGTNMPYQEVRIVDPETDKLVPIGETGEICMRGYNIMRGYFDQPEETANTIDEAGWLHSGDLGAMDKDGYVRITGRLKDMIIRGGENIYPAEIEAFFYENESIAEIAVFGVPNEKYGEEIAAWIKLSDGVTMTADELRDWARGRIAHFKVPRLIRIVDEFPMTVTGKIQKYKIREQMAKQELAMGGGVTLARHAEQERGEQESRRADREWGVPLHDAGASCRAGESRE